MKLFTRSDLERCARLVTLHALREEDPERAIRRAVEDVAQEAPDYLSREQAVEAATLAAQGVEPLKAVRAVLDERGSGR